VQKARAFGITTLEVKSGYGLSLKDEIKSLKAIQAINKSEKIRLVPTFLGAHAFPPQFRKDQKKYVKLICEKMIPEVAKKRLATYCDVFIEAGFFNLAQTKEILLKAKSYGLRIRIHSDEFKALGGNGICGVSKCR